MMSVVRSSLDSVDISVSLTLAANSLEGIVTLDFKEMRRDGRDSFLVVWRNCAIFYVTFEI